jgi:hypothetical protein
MNSTVARRATSRPHQPSAKRWTNTVATQPPKPEIRIPAIVEDQICPHGLTSSITGVNSQIVIGYSGKKPSVVCP